MSTNDKPKTTTPNEKIASAIKSLISAVESKVKSEGKTPEYTFAQRVADGVKKNWESGKVPTEQEIKDMSISLGTSKNSMTPGSLLSKATELTTRALYLSKIEKLKADIKKDNKDISEEQLASKLRPQIESLDRKISEKSKSASTTN